jgi:ketosteroid isomerase-like protein
VTIEFARREILLASGVAVLTGAALFAVTQMEDPMNTLESEVEALLARRTEAIRLRDIERLLSLYSPDVVYFDIVPPLRYSGSVALRERFSDWFGRWKSPIGQELRDVTVLANGEIAAAHMLIRASGTLKDGREVGYWVRTSDFLRRSKDAWLITHEHVSLPVDLRSESAVMNLAP